MQEPFVSVIIPSYNRASVLEKSIRSVLDQTYSALEVIVVDDGSTDNTREVVNRIEDSRLRYFWQRNGGACAARNHGVRQAKGEYIAFHDSDDICHPDKLEKQIAALQKYNADIIVCKMAMHQSSGNVVLYPKRIREGFLSPQDDLFGIGTQTIFARREVLETVPFQNDMPRYQDLEWLYRAIQKFRLYCMDEPLVDYYIGADSISRDPERMYAAFVLLHKRYPEIPEKFPALSLHIVRNLLAGWSETMRTAPKESLKYLRLMGAYLPGPRKTVRTMIEFKRRSKP